MNWTELLTAEMDATYQATEGLMDLLTDGDLDWKPETGTNWMTVGQLLMHITTACGLCIKGFVTGDWGMPEGVDIEDMSTDEMMPSAEKMPTVESVEVAQEKLAADRAVAHQMLERAGEEDLRTKELAAPWSPDVSYGLGRHALHMVDHLASHKAQLFYYLKLMGKPVHTGDLWGP